MDRIPRKALFFVISFLVASFLAPLPFVIIEPGTGRNVLGSLITISGHKSYSVTGELLLTTVYATSPDSPLFAVNVLKSWIQGNSIVLPRSVLYPDNKTTEEIDSENTAEMVDSQKEATAAALTYLGYPVSVTIKKDSAGNRIPSYRFPFKVTIDLEGTGGPSGGLVFAIGIVDKLTNDDFVAGRKVAGTGTITRMGHIGGIGGIDEKLIAAKNAGATVFLAPSENCADIGHIPAGLKVLVVSTLSEAISVLKNEKTAVPHCTWQRIR